MERADLMMSNSHVVHLVDFAEWPIGRYMEHGDASGEEFRNLHILPALQASEHVIVDLGGTLGIATSWIEETFGGLVRVHGFSLEQLQRQMGIRGREDDIETAWQMVREADERGQLCSPAPTIEHQTSQPSPDHGTHIVRVEEFTTTPYGRFAHDSQHSGEAFRELHLVPALQIHGRVQVNFGNITTCPLVWLEEVFGGLVRAHSFTFELLQQQMELRGASSIVSHGWDALRNASQPHQPLYSLSDISPKRTKSAARIRRKIQRAKQKHLTQETQ